MPAIRFIMIGGFLGAGKTTAIARLARQYMDSGKQVGIVTNDQAYDLVDTQSLRAQGFQVGEVPGACFCCKFDELVSVIAKLSDEQRPDVIITEPVGSCTDLVATVIAPLAALHGDRYTISPLAVLCKPEHGRKILSGDGGTGFSPQAAYIFLKQLEEADVVVLNKVDKLDRNKVAELTQLIEQRYPDKQVLAASAKTGEGFDQLTKLLDQERPSQTEFMEVDYDTYAAGEAELGWLNCMVNFTSKQNKPLPLDELTINLVEALAKKLETDGSEPAHLKVLGQPISKTPTAMPITSIANLVSSNEPVELSLASNATVEAAQFVVNARVAADPEQLAEIINAAAREVATASGAIAEVTNQQYFRPGRPEPTHRMK